MAEYPYKLRTKEPELKYEEFNGAKFAYVLWPSEGAPKARVLLVHGFGEYTKINHRSMDHLALAGYESFTFDQRGAGLTSPGKQKGITNEYHTFNDSDHFVAKNSSECKEKDIPSFSWGHSMGGGIILNYASKGKHRDQVSGYIASGPLIISHPHSSPNKITQWSSPVSAKCSTKTRIDTGSDLEGITSDPRYRKFSENDKPMSVPSYGSFGQIYDFSERGKRLYNDQDGFVSRKYPRDKPSFIQHGKDDTINDPQGSQKYYDMCPAQDKTLRIYDHARHSISSLEKDESFAPIFNDSQAWSDEHSQARIKSKL